MTGSTEALERCERQIAWPMLVLSLAIIPFLVIPLAVDLSPGARLILDTVPVILDGDR